MSGDNAFKLHLAEYQALRAEILAQQSVRAHTFQYGVAAIVAIWAFLLTETIAPELSVLAVFAWWLPVFVALAGLGLNYSASIGVKQAGAYLAMIEERYGDPALRGWENSLIRLRDPELKTDRPRESGAARGEIGRLLRVLQSREASARFSRVMRSIWVIIAAITVIVASAMTCAILRGPIPLGAWAG